MKRVRIGLFLAVAAIVFLTTAAAAELPSLFAGDEAWHKDAISPLVVRDGQSYIPAELCSMFDYITVTEPREGNLLLHNTQTGAYLSVLYANQSAVMNGRLLTEIAVFRDAGVYYLEAAVAAEALGLTTESTTTDDGLSVFRLTDANSIFTMDELVASYTAAQEPHEDVLGDLPAVEDDDSWGGKLKRIYLLCGSSTQKEDFFSAQERCELYGLGYTCFLDQDDDIGTVFSAMADGAYGLDSTTIPTYDDLVEALDEQNDAIATYARRRTRWTLTTGDDARDETLREAGYIPIVPDFTVHGASVPDTMLADIIQTIGAAGSCTVYLEDCWNSERMVILLSEIKNELYRTANLADADLGNET